MPIKIKRIYDPAEESDGMRLLVDRLWPRGISKERAALDEWAKQLAPSDELRKQYHSDNNWNHFSLSYMNELKKQEEKIKHVHQLMQHSQITLLTAVKDNEKNHAIVLRDFIFQAK